MMVSVVMGCCSVLSIIRIGEPDLPVFPTVSNRLAGGHFCVTLLGSMLVSHYLCIRYTYSSRLVLGLTFPNARYLYACRQSLHFHFQHPSNRILRALAYPWPVRDTKSSSNDLVSVIDPFLAFGSSALPGT